MKKVITEKKKFRKDVSATRPGHANNKQTHNYGKPIFTLLQMRIINSKEINAISRLPGYIKIKWLYIVKEYTPHAVVKS